MNTWQQFFLGFTLLFCSWVSARSLENDDSTSAASLVIALVVLAVALGLAGWGFYLVWTGLGELA